MASRSIERVFEIGSGVTGGAGATGRPPLGADWLPVDPLAGAFASDDQWAYEPGPVLDELSPEDLLLGLPGSASDEVWSGGARAPWESLAGIEDVAPDGMLALVLEQVDITTLDEHLLVETVAAWERLAAWAHLGAALGAAQLSRRASMNPHWNAPAPANTNVAGDELAMRLACSRRAADRLVRDGRALDNELLLVADAVRDGHLNTAQLHVLTDRLHDRPGQLAWAVQEAVLPAAASRTPGQLAADIDRALLAVDPLDAATRLTRAVADRHVCHPRPLPDGMAGLWAVLPATDAVRIDATLEATARTAHALGDSRTLDQLRADTLVDLATGTALLAGVTPAGTPPTACRARANGRAHPIQRTPGGDQHPHNQDDAGDPVGEDDDPGALAGEDDGAGDTGNADDEDDSGDRVVPGPVAIRIPKVRIDVTVALSTLIGLDDQPADLTGFGPISAEQARALAAGGTWRRLVTDPLSGTVLDVGRTRYRPPKGLAEHVTARDALCAGPGCSVPAHRCDLDHTTEYHGTPANGSTAPGTTSADNLGPLSGRCHRLKTDGGFTLRQVAPGTFEWHTPAGLDYRVIPGQHGHTQRLTPQSVAWPGTQPNPGYPDEPPF